MFQTKMILSWLASVSIMITTSSVTTTAFVVQPPFSMSMTSPTTTTKTTLFMSDGMDGEQQQQYGDHPMEQDSYNNMENTEMEEEQENDQPSSSSTTTPEEDPEIVALKEQIAQLEAQVKEKRRQVEYTSDQADEYSQAGYARKVAEMENMRRARSMLNTSNRSSSTAALLTKFLPTMDKLNELKEQYGEDSFGKQYNALPGTLMAGFTAMGVTEFSVRTGDKVNVDSMMVVSEEYSMDVPAGTVIREIHSGLQLEGNIIRMAECVASLGPEPTDEETHPESNDDETPEA